MRRQVVFTSVVGRFKTALLKDTFNYANLDALYTGFSGFTRNTVFYPKDAASAIPVDGVTIDAATDTRT
jgi:hypothetical protein